MKTILTLIAALLVASQTFADAVPGKTAPAFELKDALGKTHKLSDYSGKWVVLEWFNEGCPFVKKHYKSNNMQKLQEKYTGQKAVWLTILSSAKGKQGYYEPSEVKDALMRHSFKGTAFLLDSAGTVGKAYGAKTTPHMYVINPKGEVAYAGAIDSNDSSDPEVIPTSTNYVAEALDAGMAGKKIATSSTKPYGCSVKY